MWEDMTLYLAWRGDSPKEGVPPTPTKKRIEYAEIVDGQDNVKPVRSRLAVGVWDDEKYTPLNRGNAMGEIEWLKHHGSIVLMPSSLSAPSQEIDDHGFGTPTEV